MTNITLSIDDEVYKKMKKHSEIRWSEFVRKEIKSRVEQLEKLSKNSKKDLILADEALLAEDWLSKEDIEAWRDL